MLTLGFAAQLFQIVRLVFPRLTQGVETFLHVGQFDLAGLHADFGLLPQGQVLGLAFGQGVNARIALEPTLKLGFPGFELPVGLLR